MKEWIPVLIILVTALLIRRSSCWVLLLHLLALWRHFSACYLHEIVLSMLKILNCHWSFVAKFSLGLDNPQRLAISTMGCTNVPLIFIDNHVIHYEEL